MLVVLKKSPIPHLDHNEKDQFSLLSSSSSRRGSLSSQACFFYVCTFASVFKQIMSGQPARWLTGERHSNKHGPLTLILKIHTKVEERTDSARLSSDLHTCAAVSMPTSHTTYMNIHVHMHSLVHTQRHTNSKVNKRFL